jgi:biopolymer transport protein ExbD
MRLPPSEAELGIPNMMPLIDVVFLLLIFFLVASRFEQEEKQLKVMLPEVAEAQPLAVTPQDLVINITPEGQYVVAQRAYSEGQLASLLAEARRNNPHQPVLIRGDGRAAWKHGVRAMGLCNQAKIENYRVAAIPENERPAAEK